MHPSPAADLSESKPWQNRLHEQLPLLGHRNWIVVADSAYPLQTSPGIETVDTGADHISAIETVLAALENARHVRPIIYLDAELSWISELHAPGVDAFRARLAKILATYTPQSLPHEEIIAKLDAAGQAFKILLLKTNLTIPYTSLFFQLECGYWTAEAEEQLRAAFKTS